MRPAAAPAKVNLWLHVGRKRRRDGYHKLNSLIVFATEFDEIAAEPADDLTLQIEGPYGEGLSTTDNLVLDAAEAFAKAARKARPGAHIRLTKNLPVAAGLGGGSSDAAATLRILNEIWEIDWPLGRLQDVAAKIGADTPVCVDPRPTIVTGVGERLAPLESWPELHAVLVNPGVALSTAEVFRAYDVGHRDQPHDLRIPLGLSDPAHAIRLIKEGSNDLEGPAVRLCSQITPVLETIRASENCCLARMSGSGATCFGLYESEAEAKRAAESIAADHGEWWVRAVKLGGCDIDGQEA